MKKLRSISIICVIISVIIFSLGSNVQKKDIEYKDIEDIILNNSNTVRSEKDIQKNSFNNVIVSNNTSCFFSAETYYDKLNDNFNIYRLINYTLIQKEIFSQENKNLGFSIQDLNEYLNSDKLEINFNNIVYIRNIQNIFKEDILINQEKQEDIEKYLFEHFDKESGFFYSENTNEVLRKQIFASNQALRFIESSQLNINKFEGNINKSIQKMEDILYKESFENDILLLLGIIHNLSMYKNMDDNYNFDDSIINKYISEYKLISKSDIIAAFKNNDMYLIEILSSLNRLDKLQYIKIDKEILEELSFFSEKEWKELISQDIGLAYAKLNLLREFDIDIPDWIQGLVDNYKIFIYEDIPIVNLEEQYYGAIILKYFNDININFNKELFLKTCTNTISNNDSIKNIYYLYKIYQLFRYTDIEQIKILQDLYKSKEISMDEDNYEEIYYVTYLNKNLLGNSIKSDKIIYNNVKLNKFDTSIYYEKDIYYLIKNMIENKEYIDKEYSKELVQKYFIKEGYSADGNATKVNIYSTYRMLELFFNGLVYIEKENLNKMRIYNNKLNDELGFYYIQDLGNSTGTNNNFTMKSWCFGLAIENILNK